MFVALLYNPLAGAGRALRLARLFETRLRHAGFRVTPFTTHSPDGTPNPPPTPADLHDSILAVIGGDGTIHRAAPLAAHAHAPIYHIPAGTENLFARHYRMSPDPDRLIAALRRGKTTPMDLGVCNDQPFVIMASIGPDAGVIHRLHATRQGPIRQWSYAAPVLAEILEPRLPVLTITADDQPWLVRRRGLLVLANSPHYAWRLNPARDAHASDGMLDAAFYPADTIADTALWAAHLLLRRTSTPRGVETRHARRFVFTASPASDALLQLDGEAAPSPPPTDLHVRFEVGIREHTLTVLDPS